MNIEEKAKAYDEALERAKDCLTDRKFSETEDTIRSVMEYIFPELAESDDERVRKWILEKVQGYASSGIPCSDEIKMADKAIDYLVKQKENPKSSDSIPPDCVSDVKYEDRWHKVEDSLPDNGREVLAKDTLGNLLLARYDGEGWDVSVYDDEDYRCHNGVSKWREIPSEKQKEHQSCPDAPKEKSVDGDFYSSDKDKNLDEIAQDYVDGVKQYNQKPTWDLMQTAVCYGANWQMEQFEKNRLANCDAVSKEECDRETDFAMEIIEKEHRHPTFNDAINYGMRLQKEQKPVEWKPQPESLEALMYAIEGKWDAISPTSYLSRRLEDLYEGLVNTYNVDESLLAELPKTASRAYTSEDIEELRELKRKIDASMEQNPAEKQDYSGLNDLERAILRGFLSAGVENVPVTIIKETAKECLAQMKPAEWCDEDEKMLKWLCRIIHSRVVNKELSLAEESELGKWIDKRLNHEPQHEKKWSEFDEDCLRRAIWYVENPAPSVVKNTNLVLWLQSLPERFNLQPNNEWSEEDRKMYKMLSSMIHGTFVVETQETQDKLLSWLKSLLERLNLQSKEEWSEEDEMKREGVIQWLREYQKNFNPKDDSLSIDSIDSLIDWFKSLRPSWKPSEEFNEEDKQYFNNLIERIEKSRRTNRCYVYSDDVDWLKSKLNGNSCK